MSCQRNHLELLGGARTRGPLISAEVAARWGTDLNARQLDRLYVVAFEEEGGNGRKVSMNSCTGMGPTV